MSDNKKLALLGFIVGIFLVLFFAFWFRQANATNIQLPKVNICHCPDGNPNNCNTLHIAVPAAAAHLQNHEADYAGVCKEPEPEDVCENLEGVQEETPEGYVNEQGYCYIPEEPKDYCDTLEGVQAEDEACPREEEEEPKPHNPPTFAGSSTDAPAVPQCVSELKPAIPYFAERIDADSVRFVWHVSTDNPSKQSFMYGYSADNLPYSVLDFSPSVNEITINGVLDKVHVWGVVRSYRDGCVSDSISYDP